MTDLKPCPFGADHKVWIGVHDDEGNYHGTIGCEYEADHWSGITYALHHGGWGDCPLCTAGEGDCMGGMLFDTPEDAAKAWNIMEQCDRQRELDKRTESVEQVARDMYRRMTCMAHYECHNNDCECCIDADCKVKEVFGDRLEALGVDV